MIATTGRFNYAAVIFLSALLIISASCGMDKETNQQPIDQYNLDNSNNYKYIFKDVIKKNREKEDKYKKGPFED